MPTLLASPYDVLAIGQASGRAWAQYDGTPGGGEDKLYGSLGIVGGFSVGRRGMLAVLNLIRKRFMLRPVAHCRSGC